MAIIFLFVRDYIDLNQSIDF
jgi:hypothetical protein